MNRHHIPTLAAFVEAVSQGALMSLAIDERLIGQETGKIVIKILQGTPVGNLPVIAPDKVDVFVNKALVQQLGLGDDFLTKAKGLYPQLTLQE
jgi:putative ABC transport system substrate-binding protein